MGGGCGVAPLGPASATPSRGDSQASIPASPSQALTETATANACGSTALQGVDGAFKFPLRQRCLPVAAVQPKSRVIYNQFIAGPEWFDSYPGFAGGAPNYEARWGPEGEPFWQFQLRAAAARVRHAAGSQADPGARTLGPDDADIVASIYNPDVRSSFPDLASILDVVDA